MIMKQILVSLILVVCLVPCFAIVGEAERVYTNSNLKQYNKYRDSSTVKSFTETSFNRSLIRIKDQNLKWTDSSSGYASYSWKVKLANTSDENKEIYLEFNLLDKKEFILDMTNDNVIINAHTTQTFRGTGMLKKHLADQVKKPL